MMQYGSRIVIYNSENEFAKFGNLKNLFFSSFKARENDQQFDISNMSDL